MGRLTRAGAAVSALLGAAGLLVLPATAAGASPLSGQPGNPSEHAVFVQTNALSGNAVAVYDEASDGTLSAAGTYQTGGLGGQAVGSVADHLASQGSLAYDPQEGTLLAVNAGSDTVSVFAVRGDRLLLRQVLPSGGTFPVSVAVHQRLAYVLNAGGAGSVAGFRVHAGFLVPIFGSTRSLGLANTTPPAFLTSPGQVGFSPDGSQLLVTTKASTSAIDIFAVDPDGRLATSPVSSASSTPVPFAFTFTPAGQLVVAQAGGSAVGTYDVLPSGSLLDLATVADGQQGLCWIAEAGDHYYVANAGSADLSAYSVSPSGTLALVGTTGVVASTDAGPIDLAASVDGQSLYVEAGAAGAVDEFNVSSDGSLTAIGSVTGLGAGIEGITTS